MTRRHHSPRRRDDDFSHLRVDRLNQRRDSESLQQLLQQQNHHHQHTPRRSETVSSLLASLHLMSCVSRRLVGALHVPLSYLLMVLTGVDLGPDGAPSGKYSLVLAKAAAAASRRSLPLVRASAGSDTCANTSGFPRPFLLGGKNGSGCRSFSAAASSARSSRDFRGRSAHAPGSYLVSAPSRRRSGPWRRPRRPRPRAGSPDPSCAPSPASQPWRSAASRAGTPPASPRSRPRW